MFRRVFGVVLYVTAIAVLAKPAMTPSQADLYLTTGLALFVSAEIAAKFFCCRAAWGYLSGNIDAAMPSRQPRTNLSRLSE